jgi:4-hydroxybenzoyl-CoA thioesterase
MAFFQQQKVLFKHCDPAGIVFYPRYFEMMNDMVEAFFEFAIGCPFEQLHIAGGVPTAQIETRFAAPSRHGDILKLALDIDHVGGASARYRMTAHCAGQLRFETKAVLVYVDKGGKPAPWPADIRQKLNDYRVQNGA